MNVGLKYSSSIFTHVPGNKTVNNKQSLIDIPSFPAYVCQRSTDDFFINQVSKSRKIVIMCLNFKKIENFSRSNFHLKRKSSTFKILTLFYIIGGTQPLKFQFSYTFSIQIYHFISAQRNNIHS